MRFWNIVRPPRYLIQNIVLSSMKSEADVRWWWFRYWETLARTTFKYIISFNLIPRSLNCFPCAFFFLWQKVYPKKEKYRFICARQLVPQKHITFYFGCRFCIQSLSYQVLTKDWASLTVSWTKSTSCQQRLARVVTTLFVLGSRFGYIYKGDT